MNKQSVLASFKYQLKSNLRSVVIYYIVIVCVIVMFSALLIGATVHYGGSNYTLVGIGNGAFIFMASCIFLFVVGLNTFKENFGMLLQNGLSRKSVFWGRNLSAAALCCGMAFIDTVLAAAAGLFARGISGADYYSAISVTGMYFGGMPVALQTILGFFYSFFTYLLYMTIGYFITIMFYRLNRTGKIIVGAGVPVFFGIVFPTIDGLVFQNNISSFFYNNVQLPIAQFLGNYPAMRLVSNLLGICVAALLCWLLMRKAIVRK